MISFKKIKDGASAELIAHKKNRIVSVILLGFAGLFYGFGTTARYSVYPSGIAIFIYVVSLICLFNAGINVFKDMHDIPSADVQMSMPLNSTERYFSRLLTIFYIWALPFLISAACAILLSMVNCIINTNDLSKLYDSKYVTPAEITGFNFRLLLCYTEALLFIISTTVICQCCIGSKAESKYMPLLVMAVIYFLPVITYYSVSSKFADVDTDTFLFLSNISIYSDLFDDDQAAGVIALSAKCLIWLAVIFCSVFIYKKRDARSVGRPIVFTAFFETVTGLSLFIFFNAAHIDGGFNLTALFLAWLGSIVLRVIASRKEFAFSKIAVWSVLYLVYYAVFLLFMFAAFKTGGFGALYRVPDKADLYAAKNISVTVYPPDYYNHYNSEKKYSMDKDVNCHPTKDLESVGNFLDYVSDEAKLQSRIDGFFVRNMFGRGEQRDDCSYLCSVTVSSGSYYYNKIYEVRFYLPADEVNEFIEECRKFQSE